LKPVWTAINAITDPTLLGAWWRRVQHVPQLSELVVNALVALGNSRNIKRHAAPAANFDDNNVTVTDVGEQLLQLVGRLVVVVWFVLIHLLLAVETMAE
jgi:hypothetical protein